MKWRRETVLDMAGAPLEEAVYSDLASMKEDDRARNKNLTPP
jgi:hypothetical protein